MKKFLRTACLCSSLLFAGAANATTYNFSYTFDSFTSIAGSIDGISSLGIVTVNDVAATISSTGGSLGVTSFSFDTSLGGFHISGFQDSEPGRVALDGSLFDLAVVAQPVLVNCLTSNGFCLISNDTLAWVYTPRWFNVYALFPADFSITPVPVPAALPLFGAALGLLGFIGFRRKRVAA